MNQSKISVQSGGLQEAINYLSDNDSPNVLIIESSDTGDALLESLEGLAEVCSPDSKVILIGAENDISLYRKLLSMGLSEYFPINVSSEDLLNTIKSFFVEGGGAELGRVIAFIGARGGVGSSTVAANTAYSLGTQFDENVILVDLDLAFGTAAMAFNLQQRQSLVDALSQPGRLDDVLMARFMLKYNDNLSIIPSPSSLVENFSIQLESFEVMLKLVRQMSPFIVLDVPHLWQHWIHEVLLDSDDIVVVAYPDLLNMREVKNLMDSLTPQRGKAPTRLVFNRIGLSKKTELSPKDFESNLKITSDFNIPYDAVSFGTAMNNGQAVVQANKKSKAVPQFNNLATLVSGRQPVSKKKTGFSFLKSK